MPSSVQSFFDSRFGADFSEVRVHSGSQAGELTQALQAKAFTVGNDVVFGEGQYSPGSTTGRQLLAHELTHVVQQGGGQFKYRSLPAAARPMLMVSAEHIQRVGECTGRSRDNCNGPCTTATREAGRCRHSGTIKYGCVCYPVKENSAVKEAIVTALLVMLALAGIALAAYALALLIACIFSGVCEAAAIIGLVGVGAAVLIITFLRRNGVTVDEGGGAVAGESTGSRETPVV